MKKLFLIQDFQKRIFFNIIAQVAKKLPKVQVWGPKNDEKRGWKDNFVTLKRWCNSNFYNRHWCLTNGFLSYDSISFENLKDKLLFAYVLKSMTALLRHFTSTHSTPILYSLAQFMKTSDQYKIIKNKRHFDLHIFDTIQRISPTPNIHTPASVNKSQFSLCFSNTKMLFSLPFENQVVQSKTFF